MSGIKYYKVQQVREVRVCATSVIDAARIGEAAFTDGQISDREIKVRPDDEIWGNTSSLIKTTNISAFEEES